MRRCPPVPLRRRRFVAPNAKAARQASVCTQPSNDRSSRILLVPRRVVEQPSQPGHVPREGDATAFGDGDSGARLPGDEVLLDGDVVGAFQRGQMGTEIAVSDIKN